MIRSPFLVAATLAAATLAGATIAPRASADTITIDFDSLSPDSTGVLGGSAVTNYLAGYGVTLENFSSGGAGYVVDTTVATYLVAPSAENVFVVAGSTSTRYFDFKFTGTVDNVSFTRAGVSGANSPSGTSMAAWSATAYSSTGTNLGSVSSSALVTFGDVAAQTYTFNVTGISYITFYSSYTNSPGYALPMIDDITYSAVPEPTTLALFGLGAAGIAWRKRRKAASA